MKIPFSGVSLKRLYTDKDNELNAQEDSDCKSFDLSMASMEEKLKQAVTVKDLNLYDKKDATNDNEKW